MFLIAAPADVVLGGSCKHMSALLGKYTLEEGRESGGRPVYRKGEEDRYLFFFGGYWRVGANANVGKTACMMYVIDAALHPGAITGVWEESNGTELVAAPGVKAVGGGAWPAAAVAHTVV